MEMTRAQTEVRRVALDPHREAAQALVEVVMVVPVAHVRREMESAQPGFPVRKVTAPTATDQLVNKGIVLTAVAHKVNVSRARAIGIASARGSKTPPRSRCLQVGVELPAAALARSN